MTNNVTIDYKLTGTGWAACHIGLFGTRYTVTASYLSDALLALVNGTNHLLAGGAEARFSFDEEPGEYRWILRRTGDGGMTVRILAFPQLWGGKPDEDGDVLADATCQLGEFARALLLALNTVLDEVGVAGYRDTWSAAAFPSPEYRALCVHLGATPSASLKVDHRQPKRSQQRRHRN